MRASEFIREEDIVNEVMPLVKAGAATAGTVKTSAQAVRNNPLKSKTQNPGMLPGQSNDVNNNDTIGDPNDPSPVNVKNQKPVTNKNPATQQAIDRAKDEIIRPGSSINLPTDSTGGPAQFKVTRVSGNEVEVENPNPGPGEPKRIVHKKSDIKGSMSL